MKCKITKETPRTVDCVHLSVSKAPFRDKETVECQPSSLRVFSHDSSWNRVNRQWSQEVRSLKDTTDVLNTKGLLTDFFFCFFFFNHPLQSLPFLCRSDTQTTFFPFTVTLQFFFVCVFYLAFNQTHLTLPLQSRDVWTILLPKACNLSSPLFIFWTLKSNVSSWFIPKIFKNISSYLVCHSPDLIKTPF